MVNPRPVVLSDLDDLLALEESSFAGDRLSRRSFRHWITADRRIFLVAESDGKAVGYLLILLRRAIRLARLYSIAVDPNYRGGGIARRLLLEGERLAQERGRFYLRLEVSSRNHTAIALYRSLGYQQFGIYRDYYEDHGDAVRMQKRIRFYTEAVRHKAIPWVPQTTAFTCGPTALMMAMSALNHRYMPSRHEELQLWREATTIYMTSGHGGCHPLGLALAAQRRGFAAEVWINQEGVLFIDSVRDDKKKRVIELVHQDFLEQAELLSIPLHYADITQDELIRTFHAGGMVVILISTYSMDRKKAPHWVTFSGYDDDCLYVHDPEPEEAVEGALGAQFLPISRADFERMSRFGASRLRTAVILNKQ